MSGIDHSKCSASTGVHESTDADGSPSKPWGLTYGQGKLNEWGYWSKGCAECARNAEKRDGVPEGSYWPFPPDGSCEHGTLDNYHCELCEQTKKI